MTAGREQDAQEAAGAISALIDAAVRDFRTVYPEPHALAPNLALAVQAQNVLRAFAVLLPSPPATAECPACADHWTGCDGTGPHHPSPPATTGAGEADECGACRVTGYGCRVLANAGHPEGCCEGCTHDAAVSAARLHEFTPSGGPEPRHAPWCWCQSTTGADEASVRAAMSTWPDHDTARCTRIGVCPDCAVQACRSDIERALAASSPPATDGDAAATWAFGDESAALLIARAAWPFDTQVAEWAPRMVTDRDLYERTVAAAGERLRSASAAVLAALPAGATETGTPGPAAGGGDDD